MSEYSLVPLPVNYEEVAATGPSGQASLRSGLFPGPAAGERSSRAVQEMSSALNAPHYTGPHSSLLQASASMPSLWVAGDNPRGVETR